MELYQASEGQAAIVHEILPRKGVLKRSDPSLPSAAQIVAANIDGVSIVSSMNQDFNPRRLERFLVLAWDSGAEPIIVLTKSDLVDDVQHFIREATLSLSRASAIESIAVSRA